jgi:hypothetical protein
VANGIAYDAQARRLFVTGKNWPHFLKYACAINLKLYHWPAIVVSYTKR